MEETASQNQGWMRLYNWARYTPTRLRRWLLEDQANRGLGGPPNNWRNTGYIEAEKYVDKCGDVIGTFSIFTMFCNDAHEVWIGERYIEGKHKDEEWVFHCNTRTFREITLWYLWRWIWDEWFGLRRWLYYKWLCDWRHRKSAQTDQGVTDVHM